MVALESDECSLETKISDLQYLNPKQFASFAKDIANYGLEKLCKALSRAWGVWWMQDGSVDITQIDNEFHRVRYVDFETGELKHAFVSFEENAGGSAGQLDCLRKSIVSLYPPNTHANVENILQLINAHHHVPMCEDLPGDSVLENEEVKDDEDIDMDEYFRADDPF